MTTALITGATAGIGHEFARQLAERGDDLVIVARDRGRLEDVSDELTATYRVKLEILPADLGDREELRRVADRVADPARPIDLLVNNAGYALRKSFLQNDIATEQQHLDVLCRAVLVLSHAAGRAMKERGRGAIVNVSSVAGFIASGTYSAAKSFVTVFSEGLASELAGTGVTVTALCPGFTRTEFHDRAGLDMAGMPTWMWLQAPKVVAGCLVDVARGKVISVPGAQYKAAVGLLRVLPRPVARSGRLAQRHRKR